MDAVDGLGSHVHRALEAEGHIRAPQVVVDGLGQGDDVQALLAQEVGGLMGAVASQDHQAVQLELVIGLLHGRNLVHPILPGDLDGLEGCAACPKERAALGQDTGEVSVGQQLEPSVDQPLVTILEAVDLHFFSRVEQRLGDAPHGRVQGLTVPAAGQHTDPFHGKALLCYFCPYGVFLPCLLYSGLGRSTSGKLKKRGHVLWRGPLRRVQHGQEIPFLSPRFPISVKEREHFQHMAAFIAQTGVFLYPLPSIPREAGCT